MYKPTKVRHINFSPSYLLFDARHVFNAINAAKQEERIAPSEELNKLEIYLGQLSLHLATRANILKTAVEAMNRQMEKLIELVKSANLAPECALTVPDEIVYGILLHMDSFFFEAKAFEEGLRTFFMNVAKRLLNRTAEQATAEIQKLVLKCGEVSGEPWREFLYRVRRLFIHTAAPWIVVDISKADQGIFDFLLLSENITDFTKARPDSFFPSIRDMNQLWTCMQTMAQNTEDNLIAEISQL